MKIVLTKSIFKGQNYFFLMLADGPHIIKQKQQSSIHNQTTIIYMASFTVRYWEKFIL